MARRRRNDNNTPSTGVTAWVDLGNGGPRVHFPLNSLAELEQRKDELIRDAIEFQSKGQFIREITDPAFIKDIAGELKQQLPLGRMVAAKAALALFKHYQQQVQQLLHRENADGVRSTRPFLRRTEDANKERIKYTFHLDDTAIERALTSVEQIVGFAATGDRNNEWEIFAGWIWTNQMAQAMEDLEARMGTTTIESLPTSELMRLVLAEHEASRSATDEFCRLVHVYAEEHAQLVITTLLRMELSIDDLERLLGLHADNKPTAIILPGFAEHIDAILRDPTGIHILSPRRFEELVAFSLERHGYRVRLTPPTRDGGYDIEATRQGPINERVLIECKHYSPDHKVGRPIIDALLGVLERERANSAVLATSSAFSREALALFKKEPWRLQGLDYHGILAWFANARQRKVQAKR